MTPLRPDQITAKRAVYFYFAIAVAHTIGYLFGNMDFGLVFLIGYTLAEIFWPIRH